MEVFKLLFNSSTGLLSLGAILFMIVMAGAAPASEPDPAAHFLSGTLLRGKRLTRLSSVMRLL